MGEFIPPINLPLEGVKHAKWLQDRALASKVIDDAHETRIVRLEKAAATLAKQTVQTRSSATANGLPDGGNMGQVLRKLTPADGEAFWSNETLQNIPSYGINLSATDPFFSAYVGNGNLGFEGNILPNVEFIDNGTGLGTGFNPILTAEGDQFPVSLMVWVNPASDMEAFKAFLPVAGNPAGNTAPFWSLQVINLSATNRAVLEIGDARLIYAGTTVPVNGDEQSWELKPGYVGSWFVTNSQLDSGVGTATPMSVADDNSYHTNPHPFIRDEFYTKQVRGRSSMLTFEFDGTVATGLSPRRFYNDRPEIQYVSFARATVTTAPAGSALEVDILVDGVAILTAPLAIAAAATTGTLEPDAIDWPFDASSPDTTLEVFPWEPGSVLTVEVTQVGSSTPGSNLTVQVWAG